MYLQNGCGLCYTIVAGYNKRQKQAAMVVEFCRCSLPPTGIETPKQSRIIFCYLWHVAACPPRGTKKSKHITVIHGDTLAFLHICGKCQEGSILFARIFRYDISIPKKGRVRSMKQVTEANGCAFIRDPAGQSETHGIETGGLL